jgi:hypothetical protein
MRENFDCEAPQSMPRFATSKEANGMPVGCRWGWRRDDCGMPVGWFKSQCAASAPTRSSVEPTLHPISRHLLRGCRANSSMEGFDTEVEFLRGLPGPFAYYAFQCHFPGCNARYQRKEHLNRHQRAKHTKQQGFICSSCGRKYQRRYLRTIFTYLQHSF